MKIPKQGLKPIDLTQITIPGAMVVCVDTGEQNPLFLGKRPIKDLMLVRKNLKPYGSDYSILGMEDIVGIERKSHEDLLGSLGSGRDRFMKSLEKLSKCRWKYLLIEVPFIEVISPHEHSGLHPRAAFQSLISIGVRYNIDIMYCDNRTQATWRLLHQLVKIYNVYKEESQHD